MLGSKGVNYPTENVVLAARSSAPLWLVSCGATRCTALLRFEGAGQGLTSSLVVGSC